MKLVFGILDSNRETRESGIFENFSPRGVTSEEKIVQNMSFLKLNTWNAKMDDKDIFPASRKNIEPYICLGRAAVRYGSYVWFDVRQRFSSYNSGLGQGNVRAIWRSVAIIPGGQASLSIASIEINGEMKRIPTKHLIDTRLEVI